MEKLLTVVIPTYNTEKYLRQCLNSLLQTEYAGKTEILVVNDGSRDGSGAIADGYAKEYPGIVSVIHKENGGHGSTINSGIQAATGKYFKVLDSDDWVDIECYHRFLDRLQQLECDLVATPFVCVYQKDGKTVQEKVKVVEGSGNLEYGATLRFSQYAENLHIRMHQWTIRTSILKEHDIRLTERSFYVDMQYILYPVPWVQSFCILDLPVYRYRLGTEGQSVAVKSMQKNRAQHQNVLSSLVEYYNKRRAAGDAACVLSYIAKGIAKMQADEVQICLSLPIGKEAKAELVAQEKYLLEKCPAAYKANEKISIRLLRWSRYGLYRAAAVMWQVIKR